MGSVIGDFWSGENSGPRAASRVFNALIALLGIIAIAVITNHPDHGIIYYIIVWSNSCTKRTWNLFERNWRILSQIARNRNCMVRNCSCCWKQNPPRVLAHNRSSSRFGALCFRNSQCRSLELLPRKRNSSRIPTGSCVCDSQWRSSFRTDTDFAPEFSKRSSSYWLAETPTFDELHPWKHHEARKTDLRTSSVWTT